MADAPRSGHGSYLYTLGQGRCPECRPSGTKATQRAPELVPGGESALVCPICDTAYPVGRVP